MYRSPAAAGSHAQSRRKQQPRLLMKRSVATPTTHPSSSSLSSLTGLYFCAWIALVVLGLGFADLALHRQSDQEVLSYLTTEQHLGLWHNSSNSTTTINSIKSQRQHRNGPLPEPKLRLSNHDSFGGHSRIAELNDCLVQANAAHVRPRLEFWRDNNLPLFASLVLAPNRQEQLLAATVVNSSSSSSFLPYYWTATFSLCDITWKKPGSQKGRLPQVSDDSHWTCDEEPAVVVEKGCPHGSTVVIQCPPQQQQQQ
eukprot:CAMPEP_0168757750 /NCGR_PEP_ID=MMETSP0724-20121128/21337_1 /TAXON_ID=265536 /ORGANISM="Amphiprora sp., Strain CCMP467" /LENGTH=254 /DNA_ID=CAMNT_0008806589 /DNA_START=27 /DNA_END=788 /DNA_ORIENTATION=-